MAVALVVVVARGNIFSNQAREVLAAHEGARCAFRIYTSAKTRIIMEKLADVWKVSPDVLQLSYYGNPVSPDDTFDTLKIKGPDFLMIHNSFTPTESLEYPSSTIGQDLKILFNNRQTGTDFIFKFPLQQVKTETKMEIMDLETEGTEYQEIHVHKWLLSCRCEKLNALFHSSMKENKLGYLIIHDHPLAIFSAFLEYLYTDQLSSILTKEEEFIALLILADEYLVPRLKRVCEIKLIENITVDNVIRLFDICNLYQTKGLKHRCAVFFTENHQKLQTKYDHSVLIPIAQDVLRG